MILRSAQESIMLLELISALKAREDFEKWRKMNFPRGDNNSVKMNGADTQKRPLFRFFYVERPQKAKMLSETMIFIVMNHLKTH